jgi:hypothetical protein
VLDELPDRLEPFGLVAPPSGASARLGRLAAAAAGAAATALAFATVALVRRRRRRPPPLPLLDVRSALEEARAELARARDEADSDPEAAAQRAAGALRRFTARRFGAHTAASTTEELAARAAPAGASAAWPEILALLRRFDRTRFGPDAPAGVAPLVQSTLDCVERAAVGVVPPWDRAAGSDTHT